MVDLNDDTIGSVKISNKITCAKKSCNLIAISVFLLLVLCHFDQVTATDSYYDRNIDGTVNFVEKVVGNDYNNVANYIDRKVRRQVADNNPYAVRFRAVTNTSGVKFTPTSNELILPGLVQHRIIYASDGSLFMISEYGVAAILVNEQGPEVEAIAKLDKVDGDIRDIQVISWKDKLMIVVAIGDRLMVYVKRKTSDDINVPLQRIQNRVLNGEAIKKIKLFLRNDTIFLAVASVVSESNGALSLFKWHESHFILENRVETFATDDLFLYQTDTLTSGLNSDDGTGTGSGSSNNNNKTSLADTLLMIVAYTRQTNRKTRVNVYHIVNSKVEMLQHMYFQVNILHPFTVASQHYLLECSKRHVCLVHKFTSGKFTRTYQVDRRFTKANKVVATKGLIAVQMPDAFLFFQNASLDVVVHTSEIPAGLKDFTAYLNMNTKKIFLVFFLSPLTGLHARAVKVDLPDSLADVVTSKLPTQKLAAEQVHEKLKELQFLLESREKMIHNIRNTTAEIIRIDKPAHIKSIVNMQQPLYISNGEIKELHVNSADLNATPSELLQDVATIASQTKNLMEHVAPQRRTKRTTNDSTTLPHNRRKKLVVKNLHYDGPQFKDLLLRSHDNIVTAPSTIGHLITPVLYLTSNSINNIPLTNVVQTSTAHQTQLRGVKEFDFVTVKNLDVNHVNQVFVQSVSSEVNLPSPASFRALNGNRTDFHQIDGDVMVESLVAGSINSLPWQEIVDNVDVRAQSTIEGNVYITRPSQVKNLYSAAVNNIEIKDLMTKTTNQDVFSNIAISKFFAPTLTTETINGVNFKENVVLIGQENHIKCELMNTVKFC